METMSYSKLKKKGSNAGLKAFILFIVLGASIITYAIANEPKPEIIGSDPLANTISVPEEKEVKKIAYTVENRDITDVSGNFKASIVIPVLKIDSVSIGEINDQILEKYNSRYASFKQEMAGTVENKFTYKVTYSKYDNIINGENVLSLTIYERIVDDKAKRNTMEQITSYNIDIEKKEVLKQDAIASGILGTSYSSLIKEQIKNTVVGAKMIAQEAYTYNVTGLENCYVNGGKFHIILNPGEVADKKYSVIDILINK